MLLRPTTRLAVLATGALLFLSACTGTGGSGSAASSEPAPTPTPVPHDARGNVCSFAGERFNEGILETDTGTNIYVAVQGGAADLGPLAGVETTETLCIATTSVDEEISCGTYYTDDTYVPIQVTQTGLRVDATWHSADASAPTVESSNNYWSECSEEIAYQTGGYTGSTLSDATSQRSSLAADHVVTVANRLETWASIQADTGPLPTGTCGALSTVDRIAAAHLALSRELPFLGYGFEEVPASLEPKITTYQDVLSEAVDQLEEDSPLFDPLINLWFSAYFEWPLIADQMELDDPAATDDDIALSQMGARGRLGLVLTSDGGFASQNETIQMLTDVRTDRCDI